ncbi:aldo/keto reductase [Paraburkholderia silvatlantica]|uniref:aldo/keto reductase n=1 Tax=Paraburkholderia silvatlantica TaxID=321895 RepID=UPI0037519956
MAREQIHVTSKVWWDQLSPVKMQASLENTLRALRSDYVDLFLNHWPTQDQDLARTIETRLPTSTACNPPRSP